MNAPIEDHVDVNVSVSAAKLRNLDNNCEVPLREPLLQCNKIIGMLTLSSLFSQLLRLPQTSTWPFGYVSG